jgi:hypothetical protein
MGALLGVVVLLLVGLAKVGLVSDKKAWAQAPAALNSARDAFARGNADEAWPLLEKAYFAPAWMKETSETSRHNLDVMSVARAAMGAKEGSLEVRVFDALGVAYRDAMATEKADIPSALSSAMQALLGNKGALKADEHPDLAEALDTPAAAS